MNMNLRKEIKRILSEAEGEKLTVTYKGAWDPSDTSDGAEAGKGYTYTEWNDGRVTKAKVKSFSPTGKVDHDDNKDTEKIDVPFGVEAVAVLDGFPSGVIIKEIPQKKRRLADVALAANGGVNKMRPDKYGNPPAAVQPANGGGAASGGSSATPAAATSTTAQSTAPSSASPPGKTPTINLENNGGSPIAAYVFLMTQAQVGKLKISDEINGGFKPSASPKYEVEGLTFAGGISAVPEKKESKRIDQLQNATKMTGEHVAYIVNVTSGEIKSDGSFEPKAFLGYAAGSLRASR